MIWIKQLFTFIGFLLLQVLVFQNLHFLGICHPFVYVLFLLCMPQLPRWAEMLIGAVVGLIMDAFCYSPGVHMAACVAVMFARGVLLENMVQDVWRIKGQITGESVGKSEFIHLALWLIMCHHSIVFLLDAWNVQHILWIALTLLVSGIMTFVMALIYDAINHD